MYKLQYVIGENASGSRFELRFAARNECQQLENFDDICVHNVRLLRLKGY